MSQPNFLVFHADSWDGRALGFLSDRAEAPTPNVDRLAARGTAFADTSCNMPLCCPGRASFWSGRYAHNIEAWNNYKGLPPEPQRFPSSPDGHENIAPSATTVFGELLNAGWRTNLIGTTDFTSGGHSLAARVLTWLRSSGLERLGIGGPRTDVKGEGERANPADWDAVDKAAQWIQQTDAPFFLSVGVRCPHPFRTTSPYWLDQIDPAGIALPRIEEEPHPCIAFAQRARGCDRRFDDERRVFLRRRYAAMIAEADAMLGRVMDAVDEAGLADRTYIVFLSDHGEMNLEHNLLFKSLFYEPSVRVPMLFAGPGIESGRRIDTPVSLIDLAPTLLELAGVEIPGEMDGQSLVPALRGETEGLRDAVFSEYHGNDVPTGGYMLRRGEWKYVAFVGYPSQLFHLPSDPEELHDLLDADPERAAAMDRRLREIVDVEAVDARAKQEDRESFAQWRAGQDAASYRERMASIFGDWDDEREAIVKAWLGETSGEAIRA